LRIDEEEGGEEEGEGDDLSPTHEDRAGPENLVAWCETKIKAPLITNTKKYEYYDALNSSLCVFLFHY
jgi:hypothetical protein